MRRWYVWLSIWLSTGLFVSACGTSGHQASTLHEAAAIAPISVDFSRESKSETMQYRRDFLEAAERSERAAQEASRSSQKPRQAPTTTSTAPKPVQRHTAPVPAVPAAPIAGESWSTAVASWYGPGFYGHGTACGQRLSEGMLGVAHKSLPCGTMVTFRKGGNVVRVPVIDRGPYVGGRMWDLTGATCRALGACSTGSVEYRIG